jgi:hypothetical protein
MFLGLFVWKKRVSEIISIIQKSDGFEFRHSMSCLGLQDKDK